MASQAVLDLIANLKDNASAGMATIGDAAGKLGLVAGGVALAGVAALGAAVVHGVGDAREAAQLYAQTEAVLRSTGNAAGVTATHITDVATAMSAASGQSLFGDAQIQQSQNMLLTFVNIKGAVLDSATAIGVDMAQALGGAPVDQATRLGKALNDPIAGMSALAKVGVTFDDQQKAQIKTMQQAGDMAGAQTVILNELNKEFGGSAKAAADADGGWAQFTDRMGEAGEKVGAALLPALSLLAGFLLNTIAPAVETAAQAFSDWLSDPAVQAGIAALGDALQTGLGTAMAFVTDTAIPDLLGAWAMIEPAIGVVQSAIQTILPLFASDVPAALGTAGDSFTQIQTVIGAVMDGILAIVGAILPQVLQFWQDNGDQIMAFVSTTWQTIGDIIRIALDLIMAIVPPVLQAIAQFISDHGDAIQTIMQGAWEAISGIISAALDLIRGVLSIALDLIRGDWSQAWDDVKTMSANFVTDISGAISGFLDVIAGFFNTSLAGIVQTWRDNWAMLVDIATQTDWMAVGQSVVDGILKGLADNWNNLTSWVSDKIGSLVDHALAAIGAGSPATEWMPVGEFAVMGIIQGFLDEYPTLEAQIADLGDKMVQQAQRLAQQAQQALGGAYGSISSIDRQKAANLDAIAQLSAARQAGVQQQLDAEEQIAAKMNDPKAAAEYFAMRSRQMIELAKLNDQIGAAADATERNRLLAKYQLINAADVAEEARFAVMHAAADSVSQKLAGQIQVLLNLTDQGILDNTAIAQLYSLLEQLRSLPGRAIGGPVAMGMPYWVGERGPEVFVPGANGTIIPNGAAGAQTINNYYLNYETRQSSGSAAQDIQLLSLLYA